MKDFEIRGFTTLRKSTARAVVFRLISRSERDDGGKLSIV